MTPKTDDQYRLAAERAWSMIACKVPAQRPHFMRGHISAAKLHDRLAAGRQRMGDV